MGIEVRKRKRNLGAHTAFAATPMASHLRPKYLPKGPPCTLTCLIHADIRGYLTTIAQSEMYGRSYEESLEAGWYILTDRNPFPAVCGRICPHPCEAECNRREKDAAVGIQAVERRIGDFGLQRKLRPRRIPGGPYPERVAVIGAGPSGLSCAYQLARRGYPVTLFESSSQAGGMLRWAVPAYRLPQEILEAEIEAILELGIEVQYRTRIGPDLPFEALQRDYAAIYLAIGAHQAMRLGIAGEEAPNVWSCIDYLRRVNAGERVEIGRRVVVIGGGNSAIDAARVALRFGAAVTLLCIEPREEMPAIRGEVEEAQREGVQIAGSVAPVEIRTEGGRAIAVRAIRLAAGKWEAGGQLTLVPIEGSEFAVEADTIVVAISQRPDFTGLEPWRKEPGWVSTSGRGETGVTGVFAGGDVAVPSGLAAQAIQMGREAAEAIEASLRGRPWAEEAPPVVVRHPQMNLKYYESLPRTEIPVLPVEERGHTFREIVLPLEEPHLLAEVKRCMSCGQCFQCDSCYLYCSDKAVLKPVEKGQPYQFKWDFCKGQECNKCADECPCGAIEMV
ncbi:MAG: FAD-dependent oxidoreductase [Candidatus Tectomicrobia bacterium]|uniref:FAD-dependent oxidoreductase n=1 Tax=Tectimicrobiota bacterium TaxID=2528274 RepID=A0A932CN13_UNCTE|nr:FAD-dependent oxidoreductase [Candidatus Tectomicrobia bacterium]